MNTFLMTHQIHIGNNFVTQNAVNVVVWLSKWQTWGYFWCNSRAQTNWLGNDSKSIRSKLWIHLSWLIKCILGTTLPLRMPKMLWFDSQNGKHDEGIFGAIPGHKQSHLVMTTKVFVPGHECISHDLRNACWEQLLNAYWEQLCHTQYRQCCGL